MAGLFDFFEEAAASQVLPFAVYCKPGSNIITGIFQRLPHRHSINFNKKGFVFAPFTGNQAIFIPDYASVVVTAPLEAAPYPVSAVAQPDVDTSAKEAFERLVSKSIELIMQGTFEKLVCSRTERIPLEKCDVVAVYKKMLRAYPNAFRYCFFDPLAGLWMGATPEQLLKADGGNISTVALAGTQLYDENNEVLWPEKEKQEQQFVTDYITGQLHGLVSDISVSNPYTFRAGNIVHIKTDIWGTASPGSLRQILQRLHPTPAVCGLPKQEAMQFLLHNEGYNREYYSGFLGEVNPDGQTDLFVNLRCMKIDDNSVQLFMGCGVTKDSDPEKEFMETVNKSMTMRKILV
ncbi:isochorismate synthase [Flavobacterium cyanobacteriorum]|uniref:isochorismate synthase n=1 Tax=Flavobacterium cyanobacteriorum TaxID=2022802 RepID=A0A255ZSQ8_9FLAO|nr:isochorismate synthase [Flavobacterium cyanobacteriorum]OYQ43760.1 isochorismate synthase [Flavobacterium cyanobacteriorum]